MSRPASLEEARAAKAALTARLEGRPEVNGIGIARLEAGFGVKVNLAARLPDTVDIPSVLHGVRIVVDEIGEITPHRGAGAESRER